MTVGYQGESWKDIGSQRFNDILINIVNSVHLKWAGDSLFEVCLWAFLGLNEKCLCSLYIISWMLIFGAIFWVHQTKQAFKMYYLKSYTYLPSLKVTVNAVATVVQGNLIKMKRYNFKELTYSSAVEIWREWVHSGLPGVAVVKNLPATA